MKRRQNVTRWKLAAALLSAAVMLAGCGSASSYSDASRAVSNTQAYTGGGSDFYSESAVEEDASADSLASTAIQETNRKLIKTVNMTVETEDYDELLNTLNKKIVELGGYTEYFSTQGNSSNRYGSMTIRIPKENLDTFLEMVEGVSNITYRQENVEDVTLDYVDVESRKKMLETEQQRLLELLETADSLDDILTIESRLTEVQYELDSKESQLRTYDNQIDYSTVYLDVDEVVRYTPQEQKGTWERISTGFKENLYSVGNGIKNFFIQFIIHIPSIVVFLAMVGILALIVRFIIHMEQKHSQKVQEKRKKQQMQQVQQIQNIQEQEGKKDAGK